MTDKNIILIDSQKILGETNPSKKAKMIQYLAQQCRLDVFDVLHDKGTGHWGGSASAADCRAGADHWGEDGGVRRDRAGCACGLGASSAA